LALARIVRSRGAMAPVRLPMLAFAIAAGAWLAEQLGPFAVAPAPWASALALLVIAGTGRRAARARWITGAVVAGALATAAHPPPPLAVPRGAIADDRGDDRVTGVIRGPTTRVEDRVGARLVSDDGVAVWVWAPPPLAPGDRVAVTGRLRTPRGFDNPGEPDRARLAALRGVRYELPAATVEHLGVAGDWPWRWADRVRDRWSAAITAAGARDQPTAIVRGAVVGDRRDIDDATDAAWRAAGVYHVLSVSGLHLAVVALLGFGALRRVIAGLGLGSTRPPARWAAAPALAAAAAYTAITGAEVATLRALLVVAVVITGAALGRAVRIADAIGAAAVVLLLHRPASIHDPSFQLSFVAAAVLAALPARPPAASRLGRVAGWLARGVAASAWVTVATAPLTAAAFGQIAWGGVVGNLIVTPAIELVVIPATLFGLAVPLVGGALIGAAIAVTTAAAHAVDALARWTPVIDVLAPSRLELAAWTLAWLVPFLAYRRRFRGWLAVTAAVLAAAALLRWHRHAELAHPGELVVTFLDVGQGDAAVIETPGGATWLVDAGGLPGAAPRRAIEPGAAIARFLAARGRDRIDVVVISHPHPDHYLGLAALLDRVPIGAFLIAADAAPPPPELATLLAGRRVVVPPLGVAATSGGARLEVLAPRYRPDGPPVVAAGDPVRSVNDNSLVVAVTYAGRRVAFLGDLEEEGEHALVDAGLARADVVKVAHHGSATSSTPELVAASGASLAVISCGRANRFGFPRAAALDRWLTAGVRVLRTDLAGAITVSIDTAGAITTTARR
jgi:competence protein ComEC